MITLDVAFNGWYIASIIVGSINILISLATFIIPHRKINLALRLTFDILNAINSMLIYLATGVEAILVSLPCDLLSVIRDIIFYNKRKGNIIDKVYWPIGFDIIFALSLIWTWSGPISLLPVIGYIVNTTALYIHQKKITRIVTIIGQLFFMAFSIILLPSSGLLTIFILIASIAMFASASIGLVVLFVRDKRREKEKGTDYIPSNE